MTGRASLRWHRAAVPLAVLATVAACSGKDAAKEKRMSTALLGDTVPFCVGRFCLDMPLALPFAGGMYEVQGISLREERYAPPPEKAFERSWNAKLAAIEALKADRRLATDRRGEILERLSLNPGSFEAAIYHMDGGPILTLTGLLDAGSLGLWFEQHFSRTYSAEVVKAAQAIGRAYRPRKPGGAWPAPGQDWFYLPSGAIALEFQEAEKAEARFEGHPLQVKFKLTTQTTDAPKRQGLFDRFLSAVSKAGAEFAAGMSPVKNRGRAVAGLDGEEMIMRDVEGRKLFFMWTFPGERNSGSRPRITAQMETRDERFDDKVALWDALLDTMRPAGR